MGDTLTADEFDALLSRFNLQEGCRQPDDTKYAIRLHTVDGHFVLELSGMLLQNVPAEFERRLAEVYAKRPARHAIVDLSRVTYISSAVMGFLHGFLRSAVDREDQVVLVRPNQKVERMMRLVGLNHLFLIVDSVDLAVEHYRNVYGRGA
jgi:anti-anti-sigma factor